MTVSIMIMSVNARRGEWVEGYFVYVKKNMNNVENI